VPLLTRHSPANVEAAQLYKDNIKEYERKVKVGHASDLAWSMLPLSLGFAVLPWSMRFAICKVAPRAEERRGFGWDELWNTAELWDTADAPKTGYGRGFVAWRERGDWRAIGIDFGTRPRGGVAEEWEGAMDGCIILPLSGENGVA
jgi:hypothetical protein